MDIKYIKPSTKGSAIKTESSSTGQKMFPVVDRNKYVGTIWVDDVTDDNADQAAQEILNGQISLARFLPVVYASLPLDDAKILITKNDVQFLSVIDTSNVYIGTVDASS